MCSWSSQDSLWSNASFRDALLKYIGRIYGKRNNMYLYYTQIKKAFERDDELDLLKHILDKVKTKQPMNNQQTRSQWENHSRIDRRVQEIKFIFEFNPHSAASNRQFTIEPHGLTKFIDQCSIRGYFDLGCGDGNITAAIGAYLGLNKKTIFGGDVFEGQNPNMTFVKVSENQSSINLSEFVSEMICSFHSLGLCR